MAKILSVILGSTVLLALTACTHGSSGTTTTPSKPSTSTTSSVTATADSSASDATTASTTPILIDSYDGLYDIYQDPTTGETYEEGPNGYDYFLFNEGYGYESLDQQNSDGSSVVYTYGTNIYSKQQQVPVDFRVQQASAMKKAIANAAGNIRPHVNDLKTAIKVATVAVQVQAAGGFQNEANVDAAVKNLIGTSLSSITQELLVNGPNSDGINQMAAVANQNGFGHSPEEAKQLVMDLMDADFKFSALPKK